MSDDPKVVGIRDGMATMPSASCADAAMAIWLADAYPGRPTVRQLVQEMGMSSEDAQSWVERFELARGQR